MVPRPCRLPSAFRGSIGQAATRPLRLPSLPSEAGHVFTPLPPAFLGRQRPDYNFTSYVLAPSTRCIGFSLV